MRVLPKSVEKLIEQLSKLPGIGHKSAERLAFYLLRTTDNNLQGLAESIAKLKENIKTCSQCANLTESDPCEICTDSTRDPRLVCVVEEPLDIVAIEKTGQFKGLYHVLHGAISPINGIGPEDLFIAQLASRVGLGSVEELILATNPNIEGEATAAYIRKLLIPQKVKITRIAHGLPIGADIEYADEVTLIRALEGRREYD